MSVLDQTFRCPTATHILASDGVDDIVGRGAQQLSDDGELMHMVLAREQGLAIEHLGENAARTPDVDLDIVFLPRQHDFGGSVVSCRDVAGHLGVLDAGKAEVANLQIAVLVDKNVARLKVSVDDTG